MDKKDLIWTILISVILVVLIRLTIPILVQIPQPGRGRIRSNNSSYREPDNSGSRRSRPGRRRAGTSKRRSLLSISA